MSAGTGSGRLTRRQRGTRTGALAPALGLGLVLLLGLGVAGPAQAGDRPVRLEQVKITTSDEAITVRYRFARAYDQALAELEHRDGAVVLHLSQASWARRRSWIAGAGALLHESRIDHLGKGEVTHLLRFGDDVEIPPERISLRGQGEELVATLRLTDDAPAAPAPRTPPVAVGSAPPATPGVAPVVDPAADPVLQQVLAGLDRPAAPPSPPAAGTTPPLPDVALAGPTAGVTVPALPAAADVVTPPAAPPSLQGLAGELGGRPAAQAPAAVHADPALLAIPAEAPEQAAFSLIGGAAAGSGTLWFGAGLLGLALVAFPLSRRLKQARLRRAGTVMQVVDRQTLGPKHQLCLVSVGDRLLVLGTGDGGVQLLTELDAPGSPTGGELPGDGGALAGAPAADGGFLGTLVARLRQGGALDPGASRGRSGGDESAEPGIPGPAFELDLSARPARRSQTVQSYASIADDELAGTESGPAPAARRASAAAPASRTTTAGQPSGRPASPAPASRTPSPAPASPRSATGSGVVRVVGPGGESGELPLSDVERRMRQLRAV